VNSHRIRKIKSSLFVGFCGLSVLLALMPLAFVLFFVVSQGIRALNLDFFTQMP
jgi:ABC-type phosphate transport system permease subunit